MVNDVDNKPTLGFLIGDNYFVFHFTSIQERTTSNNPFFTITASRNNRSSQITAMATQVEDKKGNAIEEGDRVFTKIRGGKREGEASVYLEYYLTHSEVFRSKK